MVSKMRAQRIADRIKEQLSEILLYEVADPRLDGVSVTDVRVDRELSFASIYVSALEGSQRADEILDGLEHASGFLRSELAGRIELRSFPRLRFNWDPTFERVQRLDELFASLHRESRQDEDTPDTSPAVDSAVNAVEESGDDD
jgi:ribosome-binding factor A